MSTAIAEETLDLVFKALADARRRRILDLLRKESLTTGALTLYFPELDRCTVMEHLGVLERAELVVSRWVGRSRVNTLNVGPLLEIQARWLGRFPASSLRLLDALRDG